MKTLNFTKNAKITCTTNYGQGQSSGPKVAPKQHPNRRNILIRTGSILWLESMGVLEEAQAAAAATTKIPSGFNIEQDKTDGYKFIYPNGWQAVSVTNEDVVYKDIIEPLESVSVTLAPTEKKSIKEYGDLNEVAYTLADTVLTSPDQKVKLIATSEREIEGVVYYQFEFEVKTKYYERHALATATIGNEKFYAVVTGANKKRWPKMEGKLKTVIKSFQLTSPDVDV